MPNPEKFNQTLTMHQIDAGVIAQINAGYEDIVDSADRRRKRDYFRRAMELLDREVSHETVVELMADNACYHIGYCAGKSVPGICRSERRAVA